VIYHCIREDLGLGTKTTARSLLNHRQERHRHTVGAGPSWPASFVEGEAASSGLPLHRNWRPSRVAWFLDQRRPLWVAVAHGRRRSGGKKPLQAASSPSQELAALTGRLVLGQTATPLGRRCC
jgi:hypothetical protein